MADAAPRARKAMTQAISVLFELLKNVSLLFKILALLENLPNIYSILERKSPNMVIRKHIYEIRRNNNSKCHFLIYHPLKTHSLIILGF